MLKRIIKKLILKIAKEYEFFKVYRSVSRGIVPLPEGFQFQECFPKSEYELTEDPCLNIVATSTGEEGRVFAIVHQETMVAVCAYWWGERYHRERHRWDLKSGEAVLLRLYTVPDFRGLGLASSLISLSAEAMRAEGFEGLFAKIWRINYASLKAFKKAGWLYTAYVVRLIFADGKYLRFTFPTSIYAIRRLIRFR